MTEYSDRGNTKYELAICIPTMNRVDSLKKTLRGLSESLIKENLEQKVQIIVSDNGSTDETPSFLESFLIENKNSRINCHSVNVGFGRNLWKTAMLAEARYIYFCGDDDEVIADNLSQLISILKESKPKLLLLNSESGHKVGDRKKIRNDITHIDNLNLYLSQLGVFHATFIGNLVFSKDFFCNYRNYVGYIDSAYPHMVPVLDCLNEYGVHFFNMQLVRSNDKLRPWKKMQPIYTSIDLATIFAEFSVFKSDVKLGNRVALAWYLGKSSPRALLMMRKFRNKSVIDNKFLNVSLVRFIKIYCSIVFGRQLGDYIID